MTYKEFIKYFKNLKTYEDYINYLIQNSKDLKSDAIKNEISDAIITISNATSNLKELLGYINKNKDKLIENNKNITSNQEYKEILNKISNSVNHLYSIKENPSSDLKEDCDALKSYVRSYMRKLFQLKTSNNIQIANLDGLIMSKIYNGVKKEDIPLWPIMEDLYSEFYQLHSKKLNSMGDYLELKEIIETLSKNKDLPNNDVYYKYHLNYEDYIVKRIDNKFLNVKFCKVSNVNSIEWFSNESLTNKFEQDNYNTNNKNKNLKEISKEKAEEVIEKIWESSNNNLNNNGRNNI